MLTEAGVLSCGAPDPRQVILNPLHSLLPPHHPCLRRFWPPLEAADPGKAEALACLGAGSYQKVGAT